MSYVQFSCGDRVEVTRAVPKYKAVKPGMKGTVQQVYAGNIRVGLDGLCNCASTYGAYYFDAKDLKLIEEDNNELNNEGRTTIMIGNYRIAKVQYIDGDNNLGLKYRYACYDAEIQVGDVCVVKSKNHGFGIAKVVEFVEDDGNELVREIVTKVDFSAYEQRVQDRKTLQRLHGDMEARAKHLQGIAMFKMLAENDPEMASMLAEYERLLGK